MIFREMMLNEALWKVFDEKIMAHSN